jgi:hypothetical protein
MFLAKKAAHRKRIPVILGRPGYRGEGGGGLGYRCNKQPGLESLPRNLSQKHEFQGQNTLTHVKNMLEERPRI